MYENSILNLFNFKFNGEKYSINTIENIASKIEKIVNVYFEEDATMEYVMDTNDNKLSGFTFCDKNECEYYVTFYDNEILVKYCEDENIEIVVKMNDKEELKSNFTSDAKNKTIHFHGVRIPGFDNNQISIIIVDNIPQELLIGEGDDTKNFLLTPIKANSFNYIANKDNCLLSVDLQLKERLIKVNKLSNYKNNKNHKQKK